MSTSSAVSSRSLSRAKVTGIASQLASRACRVQPAFVSRDSHNSANSVCPTEGATFVFHKKSCRRR